MEQRHNLLLTKEDAETKEPNYVSTFKMLFQYFYNNLRQQISKKMIQCSLITKMVSLLQIRMFLWI